MTSNIISGQELTETPHGNIKPKCEHAETLTHSRKDMCDPTASVAATCHDVKNTDVQESRGPACTVLNKHIESTCHETTDAEESRETTSTLINKHIKNTCNETTGAEDSTETTSSSINKHHTASTKLSDDISEATNNLKESHDKHFEEEHNSVKSASIDNPDGISKFLKSLFSGTVKQKTVDDDTQPSKLNAKRTEGDIFQIDGLHQEQQYVRKTHTPTPNVRVEREVTDAADTYASHLPVRGYMVIIVNETFRHQAERKGSGRDLQYLHQLARKLGFIVYNQYRTQNVSRNETVQILREMSRADHTGCDMFMFAISTHGIMQPNPRAKGQKDHALICADDKMIFTSSITQMFNDENCPSLKNKPKIFVIQACRGKPCFTPIKYILRSYILVSVIPITGK